MSVPPGALLFLLALGGGALVQEGAPSRTAGDTITFHMDHAGTVLPSYTLMVHEDGSATYVAAYPPEPDRYSPYAAAVAQGPKTEVSIDLMLTPSTSRRLFEQLRGASAFPGSCASHAKNIANTGLKTLTLAGAGTQSSCSWNYTEDKALSSVSATVQAVALTLDEGRKLEQKHRYDRLALDPEMQFLVESAKQGNAQEIGTIAPTLRSIMDDPQVLERVRTRAAKLLAQANNAP